MKRAENQAYLENYLRRLRKVVVSAPYDRVARLRERIKANKARLFKLQTVDKDTAYSRVMYL